MATVSEIVTAMRDAAPVGLHRPDRDMLKELRSLTEALRAASTHAIEEYKRFLSVRQRSIEGFGGPYDSWLRNTNVLVTGGTGCIGSTLMAQIAAAKPKRLVSLSRGQLSDWPRLDNADYVRADIRDRRSVTALFEEMRPDVVFHIAAERDNGLAEREVHHTVTTNVFGTRNVIAASEQYAVRHVVLASTGKALRPYTPDIYCASKRVAEWLAASAAARAQTCLSAARFTHVVNNSKLHARLCAWSRDGVIRLHDPDIMFYAQSALESTQLLLAAGLGAHAGTLRVHALTDLSWPISLLDLALGVLMSTGSTAPIYFSGYDPGYEITPFPGLYDPTTAGNVSPLLSAFEAPLTERVSDGAIDSFPWQITLDPRREELLQRLEDTCDTTQEAAAIRADLDALSWSLLEGTLRAASHTTLTNVAHVTAPHRSQLSAYQQRMLEVIERFTM